MLIARGYIAFLTTVPNGKEMEDCIDIYMASPVLQGYYLCLRKICYLVVLPFFKKKTVDIKLRSILRLRR